MKLLLDTHLLLWAAKLSARSARFDGSRFPPPQSGMTMSVSIVSDSQTAVRSA